MTDWTSSVLNDGDQDGCIDSMEDYDDDDDGFSDTIDWCPTTSGTSTEGSHVGCPDIDGDGTYDNNGNCISNCNGGAVYNLEGECISNCQKF